MYMCVILGGDGHKFGLSGNKLSCGYDRFANTDMMIVRDLNSLVETKVA